LKEGGIRLLAAAAVKMAAAMAAVGCLLAKLAAHRTPFGRNFGNGKKAVYAKMANVVIDAIAVSPFCNIYNDWLMLRCDG